MEEKKEISLKGEKAERIQELGVEGGQAKKYDTLIHHCKYEENIPEWLKLVTLSKKKKPIDAAARTQVSLSIPKGT